MPSIRHLFDSFCQNANSGLEFSDLQLEISPGQSDWNQYAHQGSGMVGSLFPINPARSNPPVTLRTHLPLLV